MRRRKLHFLNFRQNKEQEAQDRQQEADGQKQAFYDEWMDAGGEENPEAKVVYEEKANALDESIAQQNESDQAEIKAQEAWADSLYQALVQAQDAYDIAQKEDENSSVNKQKAKETSELTQQSIQIDIDQQQKIVDELNKNCCRTGGILSPVKGSVAETTLKDGMVTAGHRSMYALEPVDTSSRHLQSWMIWNV